MNKEKIHIIFGTLVLIILIVSMLAAIVTNNFNVNANYICTDTRTKRVYMGNSEKYYSKDQTLIIYNTDGSELILAGEFVCEFNEEK